MAAPRHPIAKAPDAPAVETEKAKEAPADHKPPQFTGADLVAGFKNTMEVARRRRLESLARKHPEIAAMLKSKVKTPTSESPRMES